MNPDQSAGTQAAFEVTQKLETSRQTRSIVDGPRAKVAIVTGKAESLSSQERQTLRKRLLAGTIVVLFGFGIYLVRSYFDDRPLQGLHTLVVISLGAVIAVLVSSAELTTRHLRWLELATFGIPVLFFVPYHYLCVMQQFEAQDAVGIVSIYQNVVTYWFALLVIYGLFIPNNWKRAAVAVIPMVVFPVLTGVVASLRYPMIGEHLGFRELSDTAMILCVGALCATYGAEVIQSLRQEAREAKAFGQYRLLDRIGRGGMGEVYKAEHQLLKRPCAIKLIRPEHAGDPQALARFEREVRTTAKLTHWNTIDIYDYGRTDDGTFYYVMEFLPGLNLTQILDASGPMSPARVVHLISQICDALSEAHAFAFIHRDINTGNIFVTKKGGVFDVAKLLDFGLVKTVGDGEETQLTQMGSVSGTPKYMAPERAGTDSSADAQSDIYSLGAVAYKMLTGRAPFESGTAMQIIIAHVRDPVPPIRELNEAVPESLEKVILRCLEKSPQSRYRSTKELREALQSCQLKDAWSQADARSWWRDVDRAIKAREQEKAAGLDRPRPEATASVPSQTLGSEVSIGQTSFSMDDGLDQ